MSTRKPMSTPQRPKFRVKLPSKVLRPNKPMHMMRPMRNLPLLTRRPMSRSLLPRQWLTGGRYKSKNGPLPSAKRRWKHMQWLWQLQKHLLKQENS